MQIYKKKLKKQNIFKKKLIKLGYFLKIVNIYI